MATMTLLEWILSVLRDPDQRAAFQHDPDDFAGRHGFGDLSAADVHDALYLIADNQSASWDHNSNQVHYPPPHHYHNDEHAGHYLNNYISNNYKIIEDRHTDVDNSLHQRVHTDGGDFHQHIDNDTVIASGDHAVGAGGDIHDSTITSGGHNVVGHGNTVSGEHSTTAFGSGDATDADFDDTHFGSGSAVSLSGNADGDSAHNESLTSVHGGHGDTTVNTVGEHSSAFQHTDQSETDLSQHTVSEDHSHTSTHDDVNSHNPVHIDDVHVL